MRQNQALIAKWTWRFQKEKDSLCRKVIKAKYGSSHFDQKIATRCMSSSRSPWFYIQWQSELIYNNIHCIIGNGKCISYWHDIWVGDINLKQNFPLFYPLASAKEASIDDVWSQTNSCWNLCLRRNLKEAEIHEWATLAHKIPTFSPSMEEDKWIWKLEKLESFTT